LAAALQHATTAAFDERPILLRAEKDVGHGARSLSRTVGLTVDTLGFLAHELGLTVDGN
jgi:prolyl oligopeptidase